MVDIWKMIYSIVNERGIKKNWVLKRAGLKGSFATLSAGNRSPTIDTLGKIAKALDMDIKDFF